MDTIKLGGIGHGNTLRATLSATGSFAGSGLHEIKIEITRPAVTDVNTPKQYVENVDLLGVYGPASIKGLAIEEVENITGLNNNGQKQVEKTLEYLRGSLYGEPGDGDDL